MAADTRALPLACRQRFTQPLDLVGDVEGFCLGHRGSNGLIYADDQSSTTWGAVVFPTFSAASLSYRAAEAALADLTRIFASKGVQ